MSRWPRGKGLLYDLEFLADPQTGRRVAAFGYHAGYAGAALALLVFSHQLQHPGDAYPAIASYPDEQKLIDDVRNHLNERSEAGQASPRVIVIGALGRCGSGAVDMCRAVGISEENIVKWDLAETAAGGPFKEVSTSDVFINTIYLTTPLPPFITREMLAEPGRRLSVVCDVSCDPSAWSVEQLLGFTDSLLLDNPHNPIPIYQDWTTFDKPTLSVDIKGDKNKGPLSVISIDHLPSLLPREASEAFSGALLPYLLNLDKRHEDGVWAGAEKLFKEKVATLPSELR